MLLVLAAGRARSSEPSHPPDPNDLLNSEARSALMLVLLISISGGSGRIGSLIAWLAASGRA
jgi:hypothetical protein